MGTRGIPAAVMLTAALLLPLSLGTAAVDAPCLLRGDPPVAYDCIVSTIAGSGPPDVGDGGPAVGAVLELPMDALVAQDGSVYVTDTNNQRIRRFTQGGSIQTIAGIGSAENRVIGDGLPATQAQLRGPQGMAFAPDGSFYIAEVAFDSAGNLYILETDRFRIWQMGADGILRAVAGTGVRGNSGDGGPATQAEIAPFSIAIDPSRNLLYIGDLGYGPLRRVDLGSGVISTIPNTAAQYVGTDASGRILFSSFQQIKRFDPQSGSISVAAGTGDSGFSGDGGLAINARLKGPFGTAADAIGNVYIADRNNSRVRRVRPDGIIDTVAGGGVAIRTGVPAAHAGIYDGQAIAADRQGNVLFGDSAHPYIRRLSSSGIVTTVAGNGFPGFGGDGGHPLQASFAPNVQRFSFNRHRDLIFINEEVARLITPGSDGIIDGSSDERIMTIAGQVQPFLRRTPDRGGADGGSAKSAVFDAIRGATVDSEGNLYLADWMDNRVRKVVTGGRWSSEWRERRDHHYRGRERRSRYHR